MTSATRGVNLIGYLRSENGLGQVARGLAASLDAVGIPHTDFVVDGPHRAQHEYHVQSGAVHDVNLVVVNADMCHATMRDLPAEVADAYTIGMWAWEIDAAPPSFVVAAAHVDEVWTYSRFGLPAVASAVDCPVHVGPVPVVIDSAATRDRADLGLPPGPLFLFCFDYTSVFARKNPVGVVDAFTRAFPRPGEATLVVKSVNATEFPEESRALAQSAEGRPDVLIRDGYLDALEQRQLFDACDAYVSLHRAEGFGLTIAEAMLLRKPVVTTAYSGNLDFTTRDNSYLVPWTPVAIGAGSAPYPSDVVWAEPDLAVAASHLRAIAENPGDASARAERGMHAIQSNHGPVAVGACLTQRLQAVPIHQRRRQPVTVAPPAATPNATPATGGVRQQVAFRAASRIRRFLGIDDSLAAQSTRIEAALNGSRTTAAQLAEFQSRVDATPYTSVPSRLTFDDNEPRVGSGSFWPEFTERYRGTEAFIKERMAKYVDRLAEHAPVIDLGCGRGELLELLGERSVDALGVDSDSQLIARLAQRGDRVVEADAVDYLAGLSASSLGAVFSAQFVEHLRHERIVALLGDAARVLKPGGLLVVETVNPLAIAALKVFWLDPTHEKPIYPETLLLMARAAGFASGHIEFPFGSGDWDRDRVTAGEYTLVARTASA